MATGIFWNIQTLEEQQYSTWHRLGKGRWCQWYRLLKSNTCYLLFPQEYEWLIIHQWYHIIFPSKVKYRPPGHWWRNLQWCRDVDLVLLHVTNWFWHSIAYLGKKAASVRVLCFFCGRGWAGNKSDCNVSFRCYLFSQPPICKISHICLSTISIIYIDHPQQLSMRGACLKIIQW